MTEFKSYIVLLLLLSVLCGHSDIYAGQVKVAGVELDGAARVERAEVIRGTGLRPGSMLDERSVARALEHIARYYADRGYPFCTATLVAIEPVDSARAIVRMSVERGQFVRLGDVDIRAGRTRDNILHRLAGIAPGDPYSESGIALARRNLLASGLFSAVDTARVSTGRTRSLADVTINAEEFPGSRIEAALGAGGQDNRGLAGLVSLRMSNLFGTARTAALRWNRPAEDWQTLELSYREPWLAGLPLALEFSFSQQVRDSLFTQTSAAIAFDTDLGNRIRAGLGVTYSSASPGSETWSEAESSRLWALTGQTSWNNLLNPLNPSRGFRTSVSGSVGNRDVLGSRARELSAMARAELYRPLANESHVGALSGGAALVSRGGGTPEEIPWHARIPVGGTLAGGVPVRGHAEETTRAARAGWLSAEYRFLTGETGRLFAFYDVALIEQAASGSQTWRSEGYHGLGGGIMAATRLGLIEIAVAFDPRRGPGEGRLHLRMAGEF